MTRTHVLRFRIEAILMVVLAVILWRTVGGVWPWLLVGALVATLAAAPAMWKRQVLGIRRRS